MILVIILVVILIAAYLLRQGVAQKRLELTSLKQQEQGLSQKREGMQQEQIRLQALAKMHEKISISNRIKMENVKNFFDLVPDGVILEFAELREKTLRLKGTTKGKRYFNKTFQRALNSLFSSSTTRFYKLKNGHYRFSNISIVEVKGE